MNGPEVLPRLLDQLRPVARDRGLGVIFITHNPHHAYLVGNRFVLLKRGAMSGSHTRAEITLDELSARTFAGMPNGS